MNENETKSEQKKEIFMKLKLKDINKRINNLTPKELERKHNNLVKLIRGETNPRIFMFKTGIMRDSLLMGNPLNDENIKLLSEELKESFLKHIIIKKIPFNTLENGEIKINE